MERIATVCGVCPLGCGVYAYVQEGKLEKIEPIKGHPKGAVCTRGGAAKEVVYSPDRLTYPLRRVGQRGEGNFERISWDEALNAIAQRMKELKERYGAHCLAEYSGRGGWFEQSLKDIFAIKAAGSSAKNFIFPFGSPNSGGCGSICYVSFGRIAGPAFLGAELGAMVPDYKKSHLILVWGGNPTTDSPPLALRDIMDAKRRGAKVIAIDHIRSDTARRADKWFPIRPGTDGALALSMINLIIREELYDKAFVDKWTIGFKELKEYVTQFSPQEAEKITWVPAKTIEDTARAIASAQGATFCAYTGLEYTDSGVQNIRAVLSLWAITGNIDASGGLIFPMPGKIHPNLVALEPPEGVKPIGADKYPVFYKYTKAAQFMEFPKAVLEGEPYPIKGLIIDGANFIVGYPNPDLWRRTLSALELLVVIDRFMTWEAQYADFVLPASTYFETASYQRFPNYAQVRQRVIEPIGESRADYDIYQALALKLGYGHLYPAPGEELLEYVFKDSEVPLEELKGRGEGVGLPPTPMVYKKYEKGLLRRDKKPGFETPSGKLEIASTVLKEHGYNPLPVYTEPMEGPIRSPELFKKYPLILNTGARILSTFRSQHLNIPRLLKRQPQSQVLINPADAELRGIKDGDEVYVMSPRGQVLFTARLTDGITPGVVEANAGGGGFIHPEGWKRSNVNILTDFENRDPISGFPVLKALLCDVRKVSP